MFRIRALLLPLLAFPAVTVADASSTVSFADCEINGFSLGASSEDMLKIFGEPEPTSIAKSPRNDFTHREFRYDGLTISFSLHGLSAMSYTVYSPDYRLRNSIGVGSTKMEILNAFGLGTFLHFGSKEFLSYRIIGTDGKSVPGGLRFWFEGDITARFTVGLR